MPLYVTARLLQWNGSAWVATGDTCTAIDPTRIATGNLKGTLAGHLGTPTVDAFDAATGRATITIPAPGAGFTGSADLAINLSSGTSSASCTAAALTTASSNPAMAWLRGNWCGGGYAADPTVRINFGSAKSPYLYRREKY